MNYELLRKLKGVGFPQKYTFHTLYDPEAGETESERMPYEPTTDELIEELGDKFWKVERVNYGENKGTWVAWIQHGENYNTLMMTGPTPKEALINLYIELNLHKYGKTN